MISWKQIVQRVGIAAAVSFPASSGAHEFWITPDSFHAARGKEIKISLRVGDGWPGLERVRSENHFIRFVAFDHIGERKVPGQLFGDPAGQIRIRSNGPLTILYESRPQYSELDATTFEQYLRDEGLDSIVEQRRLLGEQLKPGRELYARRAKAIVRGADNRAIVDRGTGTDLELSLRSYIPAAKGTSSVQVNLSWRGKRVNNALVNAFVSGTSAPISVRTDTRGIANFSLPQSGVWLFSSVHMVRLPNGTQADWQSLWSSLTVELGQ